MIFGLVGKAQAGKDEFAKIAVEEFGATRVAFADAVKEEVADFLDKHNVCWEHRHLWGDGKDKEATLRMKHYDRPKRGKLAAFITAHGDYSNGYHYFTPRSLMQWWGTEYRRSKDPDYWVKRAADKMNSDGIYVVTDVRFPNEVDMLLGKSSCLVSVVRPDAMNISNPTHASETSLSDYTEFNYVVENNGTLEEYRNKVRVLLTEITNGK